MTFNSQETKVEGREREPGSPSLRSRFSVEAVNVDTCRSEEVQHSLRLPCKADLASEATLSHRMTVPPAPGKDSRPHLLLRKSPEEQLGEPANAQVFRGCLQ